MSVRLLIGDVREKLAELPDESVHCVVTSPPYFGLRDYGTASWEGGDPVCDHRSPTMREGRNEDRATLAGSAATNSAQLLLAARTGCGKCGATRTDKQIGLEPTPAEFVAVMVDVFREVRRVLRKDGTLWLNLGDSYVSGTGAQVPDGKTNHSVVMRPGNPAKNGGASNRDGIRMDGLLPKNLIGIPWRVAFALQADGWYLRSEIIWHKPNPMPESVTDRPTKAHEQIFLLSKSPRYFYDAAAIAEPAQDWSTGGPGTGIAETFHYGAGNGGNAGLIRNAERYKAGDSPTTRNRRSVWTVPTQSFREAHFATFPPALIGPCILAGCPKDCCAKCGAPVVREVERTAMVLDRSERTHELGRTRSSGTMLEPPTSVTTGWSPSCPCDAGTVPGTVLDCFGGAGTTGLVADRLQRNAILIELNQAYAALATNRITDDGPLFAEVSA